jgi:nucleoid-associated protein EbfC
VTPATPSAFPCTFPRPFPKKGQSMPGVDLNYFIRQANKLTEKIEQRKKELADETVEGRAGDGLVVAVASGVQELKSLKIDKKAVDPGDTAMLEDLVIAAVNAALTQSREHMQRELGKISGGVKIPGIT